MLQSKPRVQVNREEALLVGNQADVIVFDAQSVRDRATDDVLTQPADSIEMVIVNGALTWEAGAHTARGGGVVMRAVNGGRGPGLSAFVRAGPNLEPARLFADSSAT
jgi:N-acyl-D-amino-acid deacylase